MFWFAFVSWLYYFLAQAGRLFGMTAGTTTAEASALQESLKSKGETSYYFAHAKRDTGEDAAPLPVHHVVKKAAYEAAERTVRVTAFQFMDDGDWAKVYLPLEGLAALPDGAVSMDLQEQSLRVEIRGLEGSGVSVFTAAQLQHKVVVEESTCKVLKTKVLVKLRKAVVGTDVPTWTALRS